ncbi:carboxymuconolactone decarboxylase family protein [Thalassomonas sp. M1454]|uniref:carboxymuconolactone decarboxylase family protein n=1 Tax=Thalassomonas sp. M1454 TaxID=2594477 RepID=UPI0021B0928E|nr:carboxymuconolactone decarboxylase family protein [Thalassomonas sp. M1454]
MKLLNPVTQQQLSKDSAAVFTQTKQALGFVPNLYRYIALSDDIFKQFSQMNNAFANSSFSALERELIQLTTSKVNQCNYCLAGHVYFSKQQNLNPDLIKSILSTDKLEDRKLDALNCLCRALVKERGSISEELISNFLEQGYNQAQFIELIMGICLKTFTNLLSKSAEIDIDQEFLYQFH